MRNKAPLPVLRYVIKLSITCILCKWHCSICNLLSCILWLYLYMCTWAVMALCINKVSYRNYMRLYNKMHRKWSFNLKMLQNLCKRIHALYRNDPKFSDRYAWANSADPDRSSLIRVYTVCHSVCIFWTHYSMVEPYSSNFMITTNFLGVRIFRKFTVSFVLSYDVKFTGP